MIADEARHPVQVEGHTDDRPIRTSQYPSNWQLSGARAAAVVQRLIAAGVTGKRISLGRLRRGASRREQRDGRRPCAEPPGRDRPHPAAWSRPVAWRRHPMNKKTDHHRRARPGGRRRRLQDRAGQAEGRRRPSPRSTARSTSSRRSSSSTSPAAATPSCRSRSSSSRTSPAHGAAATAPPRRPRATAPSRRRRVVRDIITDELTDVSDQDLIDREGRERIKKHILKSIKEHTDVHVEEVLFPDVTVQ